MCFASVGASPWAFGIAGAVQVSALPDSSGNGYVVSRLMTPQLPLCAVAMELAAPADARGVRMEAE